MDPLLIIAIVILLIFSYVFARYLWIKKRATVTDLPGNYKRILQEYVEFYNNLATEKKAEFEVRLMKFLGEIRITGVNTEVEDIDKVFIGSSALIPIFGFPGWEYVTLHEVLLYPDFFNDQFEQRDGQR